MKYQKNMECTIEFGNSSSYRRVTIIIYGMALLMLAQSAFYMEIKCICTAYLLYTGLKIIRKPIPHPCYKQLLYRSNEWQLYDIQDKKITYKKHKIIIETGIFSLVRLSDDQYKKIVIIFNDTLSPNEYRALKIIEKLN